MAIPATGLAGPAGTPGSGSPVRESREYAQVVSQLCGKYYEGASRATVFTAMSTTGRSPQSTLTTTVPIVLYNPLGSGKRFEILRVGVANAATGTLGCGGLYHAAFTLNGPVATQTGTVPSGGTAITITCMDVGGTATSAATCISNATLAAAAVALYPAFQMGQEVGGTTANAMGPCYEDVDGLICLEPGGGWCLGGVTTTGSSPLILCGVIWREATLTA